MENIKALNDNEMEQAAGGQLKYCPNDAKLREFGLGDIVQSTGGFSNKFYDTYRKETETWKNVGSEDMLKFVERTLGADDERYKALYNYCQNGDEHTKQCERDYELFF